MAKHNVHINLPWREIGKADVEFQIYKDDEVFGKIKISKGDKEQFSKNAKKPYKISWTAFDKMIKKDYGDL